MITTRTILDSFVRKYSAIIGITEGELKNLFEFNPVVIGKPLSFFGGYINFFYSFHSIPCIGFVLYFKGKSIYFSGDHFYDPEKYRFHFL